MYRPMTIPPDDPKDARDYTGLVIFLAFVLLEVGLVYVALTGDTPFSSMARRMLETPGGAFSFLMLLVGVMFLTMAGALFAARRLRGGRAPELPVADSPPIAFSRLPGPPSLFRMPLGLAVPGAIVSWLVPLHFESLWWLLLMVPVGLMALILTMVFLPYSLAPGKELAAVLGDSRAPRLTAALVVVGAALLAGWFLGGAVSQGWSNKTGVIPALVLLILARFTFPFRPRRAP